MKNIPYNPNNQIMLTDLHTHSNYSDGELSPHELIVLAKQRGIKTIAITDHDTILGNKEIAQEAFEMEGIKIIPGIELSAKTDKGRMHILGYNIDLNNIALNNRLFEMRNNSINSVLSVIEQIKKDYNIYFSYDEIKDLINSNGNLGRPNVAKLCVKNGHATGIQDAFDKYLIDAYKKTRSINKGLTYQECIELILTAGGIPVLAHPNTLKRSDEELSVLIKNLINVGLRGIEVYHSNHSEEEKNKYLSIAKEYDLLISGGSDYHGPFIKPDIEIGTGKNNNIKVKRLTLLDYLK